MIATAKPQLAIRTNPENPNHHLWFNNGTWYVHYTIYPTACTTERIRHSLKTRDLHVARQRRDALFQGWFGPSAGVHGPTTWPCEPGTLRQA